ncbi:histidine kinase [Dyadobacter sp. LJ419]|uniref:Histidine kinase n=1 Tax=Dyadobacter chenwenxiniae TaxID=2906456 RepID=A0A9X1TE77_9BACT|nr:histidine kinase [Dyadobacter chenwenxiniae]MCF0062666.1 histidine kinase [Dyadobacter chenwenxiniae]
MRNRILIFLAATFCLSSVKAQIKWADYSHSFLNGADKSSKVGLIVAVRKENNSFWQILGKSKHFETFQKNPQFSSLRPQAIVARTVFDTAHAQFFLQGVVPENAFAYQFRVTKYPGNSVVVPWKAIGSFTDAAQIRDSGLPQMAYLGAYRTTLGSMLIVDVKEAKRDTIIATAMVAWESIKPQIMSIYTSETLHAFFRQLQAPWLPDKQSAGNFPTGLTVTSHNTNLVFALQDGVFDKKQIQYKLVRNGKLYRDWQDNDYDNSFIWLKDTQPGNYEIKIRFSAQPQNVTAFLFEIEPVWYETVYFHIFAAALSLALLGLLVLSIRQRRKIRQGQIDKSRVQLELKSVYAQFNPHFIFNALSSIQALINKQDIRAANAYLTDFAQLTRDSLVYSQRNEISLHEEIQTLDTYLRLEKLRFGFDYHINIAPDVDAYETNIPALLTQPLVENAVKHGVASMGQKGLIQLSISRSGLAMIAKLTDNGKGMDKGNSITGLGLRLTRDRIGLLNQIRPDRLISMDITNAVPTGVQITITFNQWFDESFADR